MTTMKTVRTEVIRNVFNIWMLFLILIFCQLTFAEEITTIDNDTQEVCNVTCGCDGLYYYSADGRCLINFKRVMKRMVTFYDKQNVDVLTEDGMAKSIFIEGEKIFRGILISVFLFMACASVCVLSACIYCCRINYTDYVLKKDVKALAKKLKRCYNSKKNAPKKEPLPPLSENCNVVVEEAGIFMV